MAYLLPVVIFIVLGLVFGILLVVVSRVFAVQIDPRVAQITEALPGANCGGCGHAGCADYADAIVHKGAPMNDCHPGGAEVAAAIGAIMGTAVTAAQTTLPVLHCSGDCITTARRYDFAGVQTCASAKRYYGGTGLCAYGCLGLGDCAKVCDQGVIIIENGLATFCTEKCIRCRKCVKACPNGLISLRPATRRRVDVLCSNKDRGALVLKACQKGCIGCKKCEKACKFDAIHVQDNCAAIDYEKCKACGLCAKECPRGCIAVVQQAVVRV